MVLKFWDIDNGKVKYLKHINSRNDSRLVKLREPMECDKIPLSKLDDAISLLFEFVSSIKKFDSVVIVNDGKDEDMKVGSDDCIETRPEDSVKVISDSNVDTRQDVNIEPWVKVCAWPKVTIKPWVKRRVEPEKKVKDRLEEKTEVVPEENAEVEPEKKVEIEVSEKVEIEPEKKVEKWAWGEEYDKDNGKDVPQEVSDKLNLLLWEDGGKKDGAQFLINKNVKKGVDNDKVSLPSSNVITGMVIIPKEDVTFKKRPKKEKKKRYSGYEEAVIKCSPKILKDVVDSSDAKALVNSSDLAKMMGEEFVGIDPGILDVNVRYKFFDYGLIMTVLSHKGSDVCVSKEEKIFRFRLRDDHDKLPDSILRQRHKTNV
jgi:hypothetical protein